jgi:hypothetical protein
VNIKHNNGVFRNQNGRVKEGKYLLPKEMVGRLKGTYSRLLQSHIKRSCQEFHGDNNLQGRDALLVTN